MVQKASRHSGPEVYLHSFVCLYDSIHARNPVDSVRPLDGADGTTRSYLTVVRERVTDFLNPHMQRGRIPALTQERVFVKQICKVMQKEMVECYFLERQVRILPALWPTSHKSGNTTCARTHLTLPATWLHHLVLYLPPAEVDSTSVPHLRPRLSRIPFMVAP